jgi:formylglycine-generating enzyme required for sulfatase activity
MATIDPNQKGKLLTSDHVAWMYIEETEATRRSSRTLRQDRILRFEMMAVPGGDFLMGSDQDSDEHPIHTVKVAPFFMGKYPVTQKLWSAVAQMSRVNQDLERDPANFKGENRPVERVSWLDAMEFCARLSKNMGREYRLPTEAEWEYACRARTTTKYHFGDAITNELANYGGLNSGTTPVGEFSYVNAFGLSDMHGNVWEWCMDHWHDSYEGAPVDGSAWVDAKAQEDARRLLRGGSWIFNPAYCRSASRVRYYADDRFDSFGFRLVSPVRILP